MVLHIVISSACYIRLVGNEYYHSQVDDRYFESTKNEIKKAKQYKQAACSSLVDARFS